MANVGATDNHLAGSYLFFHIQSECVGGDPSAGSPTDTLLRLNPSCGALVQKRQRPFLHEDPTRMV